MIKKHVNMATEFFKLESSGGVLLVIAALFALMLANSPFFGIYDYVLNQVKFGIGFTSVEGLDFEIKKSVLLWINDGLMAIFFFLVGLEIKREIVSGELSSKDKIILPAIAAFGGVLVPALIYYFINVNNPETIGGWAIPAATDIAFALGVLSLLGNRVPSSLKVLLLGIAVIDDIVAILIIAIFFSGEISFSALYVAAGAIFTLFLLNKKNAVSLTPYIFVTLILWIAVLESGIHATIAGVVAAMFIPMKDKNDNSISPLKNLEHDLHYWVAFAVLPIFAFANAGVPFTGMSFADLFNPVTLGIAVGLFVGKQFGVFGFMWLAILLRLSPKPEGANWVQLYGVSLLCGVGFTMSLFIGGLAFDAVDMQASVRLGVLVGSILSAIFAYCLLRYVPSSKISNF